MKTGIITIQDGENYGNRLQNYAMQESLRSLNILVDTIQYTIPNVSLCTRIVKTLKSIIKKIIRRKGLFDKRFESFHRFNSAYIKFSKNRIGINSVPPSILEEYDMFVVGSDQVWNTNFHEISDNIFYYLAVFAEPGKRIAYAASFGTQTISEEYMKIFQKELPLFKAVSVREKSGVAIAESCGSTAEVVVDPTLLLSRSDWEKIAKKPVMFSEQDYIVTYFLGEVDIRINQHIKNAAKGRRIVHLYNKYVREDRISSSWEYCMAPDEFVWLIEHASCVFTDSFHGSIFSILFHRPFQVFDRHIDGKDCGMGTRIDTLLGTFHLESCRGDIINPSGFPQEQEWKSVDEILSRERKKSLMFIINALDLNRQNQENDE